MLDVTHLISISCTFLNFITSLAHGMHERPSKALLRQASPMGICQGRGRIFSSPITAATAVSIGVRLFLRGYVRGHPWRAELEFRIAPLALRD